MATVEASLAGQASAVKVNRPKLTLWRVFIWIVLVVGAVIMLMPFVWMISSSLKAEQQVFQYPPRLLPDPPMWSNYVEALVYKPFGLYIRNTAFLVGVNMLAVLLASSFCAYGFARITFPGRDFWFVIVLATMMMPYYVLMVPIFIMFTRLGWIDTYLPLTVPTFFGGGAFNIFLMRQFFRTIPQELSDAARIDGCNEFQIYWTIFMPLAKPALVSIAILAFLGTWNDFVGPLLYIKSPDLFTVSIGLAGFRSIMRSRWDLLMAASTAMTIPVIALFFAAQRYFFESGGITLTGLK
ncbi:carbohydrate ABC transporter membrane protein 2, CUT1 family [Anaerolinea thermolimosa]|uniref:Carbohydrate ABC transporter membrane protein 2, CUT1 family n=2 Tax=Anaerolinea thermolimosa TaxID=229919 RepID=A0A7U9PT74_9CHLR|nr:carbohydrate ABC transporter permease [Anaerolinea thermolimosa]GAP08477.1 carbohydrate ABC transporter membrane protein 2, CUT1 family [Anaerolinea thermolimosa]